ncbi:hypothetical protein [Streptomyces halstedii]|uniref:hypothetical protein n=1 Tax=Streptomyces halstedii TaxID=1944 RepID=UPI0036484AF3
MHTEPMRPVLVDLYAAHAATGIRPGTLRVWLHRGKLTHHGHDHAGRTLINLNELTSTPTTNAA